MMAGTRPWRRVRRAAPLPNSVRGSAAMRTSGTVVTPLVRKIWRRREMLARGPRAGPGRRRRCRPGRAHRRAGRILAGRGAHPGLTVSTAGHSRAPRRAVNPSWRPWCGAGLTLELDVRRHFRLVRLGELGTLELDARR